MAFLRPLPKLLSSDAFLHIVAQKLKMRPNLTEDQKKFVCDCRNEMNSVYRDIAFRMLQYQEMMRRGMVSDLTSFCRIYLPDNPARCA